MSWVRRLIDHFRHGAPPEVREARIEAAHDHDRTIARAETLLDLGQTRIEIGQRIRADAMRADGRVSGR